MEERNKLTKKVGVLGIIGNLFLFIIKIIVGLMSHSRAMIADALNSAGDVFASFMTWLGNKISSVPNDDDHNYGHGKAEYIFTMLIGISMMIVALKLFYDSFMSIVNDDIVIFSWNLLITSIVTIIVKLFLYFYSKKKYLKCHNLLIKSNMLDHRNDIFLTSLTILSIIFSFLGVYVIDGIVGILISNWILVTGIKLYRESYNILMDQAIDKKSQKMILSVIKKNKTIKRIGNIYSIPVGYKYIIIINIYVDGKMSTVKSHEIADKIESEIIEKVDKVGNVIVHVEPYVEE